jgi:leucyl/phenylalanyl-tRNA--protein transferase
VSGIWGSRDVPWVPPDFADPDGFVGVGGDLSPETLIRAYTDGVFPWFNDEDPVLWWSPDPRGIIELADSPTNTGVPGYGGLHVSRRLARTIRSGRFLVTFNQCFETVMRSCGEYRPEGTWVTAEMLAAYTELHKRGHAHSVETWVKAEGEAEDAETDRWVLAGGTYGVSVGGLFAAESMFYRVTDGSKVALAALVSRLRERGYTLLDVQMTTEHTLSMGAIEIPRSQYLSRLRQAVRVRGVSFV